MPKLNVTLEGRGSLVLTDNDYVAAGGEGTIYRKANTVIKILAKPGDNLRDKVKRLAALKHEYIAAPEGVVTSLKGDIVGYFMPFVDGAALSLLFTNDFRNKENITDDDSSILTDRIRATFAFAHYNNALLVDPNELNWLTILRTKDGLQPRVIDVDSWVLDGKIPATVPKMPSIRDWHGKNVSVESDWFAFAIITFQLYCGIHPFKGTLAGYKPSELERRMKDNASVFTPGVRLNHAVRDFKVIPAKLLDWYRTVFSTSDRQIPPSPFEKSKSTHASISVARTVVTASGKLKFERLLAKTNDPAARVYPCGLVLTKSKRLYELASEALLCKTSSLDVEAVKVENGFLISDDGVFKFLSVGADEALMLFAHGKPVVADSRMFIASEAGLTELTLRQMGRNILSTGQTWGALYNSTQWFDEVGVMDAMGATFLILPFRGNAVAQLRVKELDGLKVLNAKAGHRFVSVIALDNDGEYQKVEFTLSEDYTAYTVWRGTSASADLNISILPKGVAATIVNDGELFIFVPKTNATNRIADKNIQTSMLLCRVDNSVTYIQNGEVWKVSVS